MEASLPRIGFFCFQMISSGSIARTLTQVTLTNYIRISKRVTKIQVGLRNFP